MGGLRSPRGIMHPRGWNQDVPPDRPFQTTDRSMDLIRSADPACRVVVSAPSPFRRPVRACVIAPPAMIISSLRDGKALSVRCAMVRSPS